MTKCLQCGVDNPAGSSFCENCGRPLAAAGADGAALQTLGNLNTIGGEQTLHRDSFPKDETLTLEPGTVFADRYTIESLIGIGGMGVVYRAKDRIGDRDVALKLIRSDRLGGEGAVKKLIAEGVLTQDIRHRNIVAVYHVDQLDGRPFLAMEFVDGVSLRQWHRKQVNARTDVPMAVAARIIGEVLDGLQVAHEMGVVHRDLKPENIMLTGEPSESGAPLKILDFGIARAGGQVESGTGTGLGTPRYMAPEQITNPDSAGPAADIYSLSTIFYELLVDVLPQGSWQPPSSGRSDVPAGVDALIQSGLQNRPASRPQSVTEYRDKLNAAVGGAPVPVNNRGNLPRDNDTGAKPKRNWRLIGGGVLAGIVVLGAIGNLSETGEGTGSTVTPPPADNISSVIAEIDGPSNASPDYAKLNGEWLDGNGGYLHIALNARGQFSGDGAAGDGTPLNVAGQFAGLSGNYTISGAGMSLPGQLGWDGRDCHLNFRTLMPDGSVNMQGKFHINHQPGAPCPPQ